MWSKKDSDEYSLTFCFCRDTWLSQGCKGHVFTKALRCMLSFMYMLKSSWWPLFCWIDLLTETNPGIWWSWFVLLRYDAGLQPHCTVMPCESESSHTSAAVDWLNYAPTNDLYHNCEQQTIRAGFSQRGWKGKKHQSHHMLLLVCFMCLCSGSPDGKHPAKVLLLYCHSGSCSAMNKDLIWAAVFVRHCLYPSGHLQAAPFPAACSCWSNPEQPLSEELMEQHGGEVSSGSVSEGRREPELSVPLPADMPWICSLLLCTPCGRWSAGFAWLCH